MLVSVIIPCYNVENYVAQSINTILSQSYDKLEILCLDDCSTDSTYEILIGLEKKCNKIRVYKNETNKGLIYTLNKLVSLASGDTLVRMDPDDLSETTRIERLLNEMLKYNCDIVSSNYYLLNESGRKIANKNLSLCVSEKGILFTSLFNSPIPHAPVMYRKKIFDKFSYDEAFKSAEDYKLWSDILRSKDYVKVRILPEKLYGYRLNGSSISNKMRQYQFEMHNKIAQDNRLYFLAGELPILNSVNILSCKEKADNNEVLVNELTISPVDIRDAFLRKFDCNSKEVREINRYASEVFIFHELKKIVQSPHKVLSACSLVKNLFKRFSIIELHYIFNFLLKKTYARLSDIINNHFYNWS